MSGGIGHSTRTLIDAPLASPEMMGKVGDAIWLYLRFLSLATTSGHICRARASLATDLGAVEEQLDRWLSTLVDVSLISITSPGAFLVAKLSFWSSSDTSSGEEHPAFPASTAPSSEEVPVSSKQAAAAASSKLGDRGQGEGVPLLDEVLQALGPEARDEITELLLRVPEPLVRRALRRVILTPDRQIKKSKLALFRFLLAKLADESP